MKRNVHRGAIFSAFASAFSACLFGSIGLLGSACGSSAPVPSSPEKSEQSAASVAEKPVDAGQPATSTRAVDLPPPLISRVEKPDSAPQELFPLGVFPPPDPGPPFAKSAHEGDGIWRAFFDTTGEEPDSPKKGKPRIERDVEVDFAQDAVRRLVIHPDEASRFQSLAVAAFDLRQLALWHYAGRQDVEDVGHAELAEQAGLVRIEDQSKLLAIFNEGFQPRHGHFGMFSRGVQLVPPRIDACTVAVLQDQTLRIAPWPDFLDTDTKPSSELLAYRQTPPCLVIAGEVHANLLKKDRRAWAGQQADLKTRRRSAIGLSQDGRTLFFGIGSETEPEVLAAGMRHVGAHFAAQLDINWNLTRLFLFKEDKSESPPRVVSVGSLITDMAKDRGEYISRQGKRGFFTLTYR